MLSLKDLINSTPQQSGVDGDSLNRNGHYHLKFKDHNIHRPQQPTILPPVPSPEQPYHTTTTLQSRQSVVESLDLGSRLNIGFKQDISPRDDGEKFTLPGIDALLNTKPSLSPSHLYYNNVPPSQQHSYPPLVVVAQQAPPPTQQQHYPIPSGSSSTTNPHQHHYYPHQHNQMQRSNYSSSFLTQSPPPHSNNFQQTHNSELVTQSPVLPMKHQINNNTSSSEGYYSNHAQSSNGIFNPSSTTSMRNSEYRQAAWPTQNTGNVSTSWRNSSQEISPTLTHKSLLNQHNQHYSNHRETRLNGQTMYEHNTYPVRESMQPVVINNMEKPHTPSNPHSNYQQPQHTIPPQHHSPASIISSLNHSTSTGIPSINNTQPSHNSPLDEEEGDEIGSGSYRFRKGWTKDEHIRFLIGVHLFGRGNWKNISKVITGKSPKQVQSHAQKYFLRQEQTSKTKRSIHDFNLEDLIELLRDTTFRNSVREDTSQKGRDLEELINRFESSNNNNNKDQSGSGKNSSQGGSSSSPPSSPPSNSNGKQLVPPRNKPKNKPY